MKINFAFFGTSEFSVIILEKLKEENLVPSLIITTEDKPRGRHLVINPSPVKLWAKENNLICLQPNKLDENFLLKLKTESYDLFIVASYGKIIPQNILNIPKHGTLNVHPSLLPKLRGSSPIQNAILNEEKTGVTIIQLDAEMDHGPIVAQRGVDIQNWPPYAKDLEMVLADVGGKLLAEIIPDWLSGKIIAKEQNHLEATYTKKIKKEDALINLEDKPNENLKKIRGYSGWPNAYAIFKKNNTTIRVILKEAHIKDGILILDKVIPEGKKEMSFIDFERGL